MPKQLSRSRLEERFLKIEPIRLSRFCYRMVSPKYDVLNTNGSLLYPGRYSNKEFRVLYTADSPEVCRQELSRKTAVKTKLIYKIAELQIKLKKVIDLTNEQNLKLLDIQKADLAGNSWDITQCIASAAYQKGYEALLVPSVTGKGSNLVLFPDNFAKESTLKITREESG